MAPKRWIASGLTALALTLPAAAQDPKPGDYYEDKTDLGFKVKMPARWESIPPAPDDGNLIIKYDPRSTKSIQLGPKDTLDLHAWVVKFDRRKFDKEAEKLEKKFVSRDKNLAEWLKHNVGSGFKVAEQKDVEVAKVPATEFVYSNGTDKKGEEVRVYAMLFKLHPEVDVAVAFIGPGEAKRWSKYENEFRAMARSFKPVELKGEKVVLAEGASMRDRKRAELQDKITRVPGWQLYETPNYFIVSSSDDKAFIEELKGRLEAIRTVYELDYPAAKAAEIRAEAARVKTGEQKPEAKPPEAKPEEETDEPEAEAGPKDEKVAADPMEASRCSIVRVCKSQEEYQSYGGPSGSAGYWSSNARELVVYDDKAVGGRGDTWITLNHEAFHQYIFYFYGNIAPHSWYNEGTGDFYSGYVYKNGRFTLKENSWRKETIKEAIRDEQHAPLKDLMRWTQAEYYGSNKLGAKIGQNYAQGWSLVYFLRTGKKNKAKGWDPKWDSLLEDYLRVLAATGKPDQAIEQCLAGIDLDALEAAWVEYTK